jgi:hypothetical protein
MDDKEYKTANQEYIITIVDPAGLVLEKSKALVNTNKDIYHHP